MDAAQDRVRGLGNRRTYSLDRRWQAQSLSQMNLAAFGGPLIINPATLLPNEMAGCQVMHRCLVEGGQVIEVETIQRTHIILPAQAQHNSNRMHYYRAVGPVFGYVMAHRS